MSTLKVNEPNGQKPHSINSEIFGCSFVLVLALAIHLIVLDPAFNGPDAISNFKFAHTHCLGTAFNIAFKTKTEND